MKPSTIAQKRKPKFTLFQIMEGIEGVFIMIACYLTFFLKSYRARWGLSKEEAQRSLPGDDLIPKPDAYFTHAIDIKAPASEVWPWIAQLGQGKAGFYSYEALENIVGLNIYNADEIIPEFQNPKVGDRVAFGPKDAYPVVLCEPGKAMAISVKYDMDAKQLYSTEEAMPKNYLNVTWLWFIENTGENRSRFYSRNRVKISPTAKSNFFFSHFSEPIIFAMDRKMCLGIKKRAEKHFSIHSQNL